MNKKTVRFNINSNSMKIKEFLINKDFLELEIWAISDVYPNNNNSWFTLSSMQKNIKDGNFYNKPVLGKFNNLTNNYEVHNYKTKYDHEYQLEYCDYEDGERPLGLIRESDNVRMETTEDGLHWIVFSAVLWVKYNYKGIKKLLTSKRSKVSVEVTVNKWHKDDNGVEIYDDWIFDGVTILGYKKSSLKEAESGIPSAHMTIVERMKRDTFSKQIKTLRFAYDELSDVNNIDNSTYINEDNKGAIILNNNENKSEIKLEQQLDEKKINENSLEGEVYDKTNDAEQVEETVEEEVKTEDQVEEAIDNSSCDICEEDNADSDDSQDESDDEIEKEPEVIDSDEHNDNPDEDSEIDSDDNVEENPNIEDESIEESECNPEEDMCGNVALCNDVMFEFNGEQFTAEEIYDKYCTLFEEYTDLKKDYNICQQKIQNFETKELVEQVKIVLDKTNFSSEDKNAFIERCKNKEFNSIQEATKEIAYVVFMNREEDTAQSKPAEFSARVNHVFIEHNINESKNDTCFEKLEQYVVKK